MTPTLPLLHSGKVRELYDLGGDLLMVASDRISTYDVVHPTPIPDKGKVLTGLSVLWFGLTRELVPNHFISATDGVPDELRGRALRVKRLEMLPVECVVRGYITGSGWKDYQATGKVSGIELPAGLVEEGERPEDAARRELAEETGYTGGEWELLGSLASSPSLKDNWAYLFLARGVEETAAPDPDEHELVEVVKVPLEDLRGLVQAGKIVSSSGVAAIMLALERLREET